MPPLQLFEMHLCPSALSVEMLPYRGNITNAQVEKTSANLKMSSLYTIFRPFKLNELFVTENETDNVFNGQSNFASANRRHKPDRYSKYF